MNIKPFLLRPDKRLMIPFVLRKWNMEISAFAAKQHPKQRLFSSKLIIFTVIKAMHQINRLSPPSSHWRDKQPYFSASRQWMRLRSPPKYSTHKWIVMNDIYKLKLDFISGRKCAFPPSIRLISGAQHRCLHLCICSCCGVRCRCPRSKSHQPLAAYLLLPGVVCCCYLFRSFVRSFVRALIELPVASTNTAIQLNHVSMIFIETNCL